MFKKNSAIYGFSIPVYATKSFMYHLVPKSWLELKDMVFVRIKRISGGEYAYLVANSWTGSGPRQKVSEYLGKATRPAKAKSEGLRAFLGLTSDKDLADWITKSSFAEIAAALVKLELKNHCIDGTSSYKINAENGEFTNEKGRKIVFALNDGFLCSHTAKKLLGYDPAADYSGYNLADALTAAGIAVDKDVFISLFGKMQATSGARRQEAEAAEKEAKEFYY